MVVQTLDRNPGHTGLIGLHIGAVNVRDYFSPDSDNVELQLDHLCIVCRLEPSFWEDRPEIHDLRLSSWLESKRSSGKLAANSGPVAMIPNGARSFRLHIIAKDETDHSFVPDPAIAYAEQVSSPLAAVDRRRHEVGHLPERRKKVARLEGNELPATAAKY